MSHVPTFVDLQLVEDPAPLFSVIDDAMGPCDDALDIRVQAELKAQFHRHCNTLGRSMAERMRELMALDALGEEHVRSLMLARMNVIGTVGQRPATEPVRTEAPAA